jgi:hypothetical protein
MTGRPRTIELKFCPCGAELQRDKRSRFSRLYCDDVCLAKYKKSRWDAPRPVVHGRSNNYYRNICRCDICHEAFAESNRRISREWRFRKYREDEAFREGIKQRSMERYWIEKTGDPEWASVLRTDPCSYCGHVPTSSEPNTIEHIVPLISGGGADWTNLASACGSCNCSKHSKSLLQFLLWRAA